MNKFIEHIVRLSILRLLLMSSFFRSFHRLFMTFILAQLAFVILIMLLLNSLLVCIYYFVLITTDTNIIIIAMLMHHVHHGRVS